MTKRCFKCGAEKPLDAFYRHPMMSDGRLNKCIECAKAEARSTRAARLEYYQAYDRQRSRLPHRKANRDAWAKANPRTPAPSDPQKKAARTALGNALRDGKVRKPPECQVCAIAGDVHGHHEDYSKPLDVIWVCTACHAFIHAYWRAQERMAA